MKLSIIKPGFDRKVVYARLGAETDMRTISGKVRKNVDRAYENLMEISSPSIFYTSEDITCIENNRIEIANNIHLKSRKLAKTVRECNELISFVGTLGEDVDKAIATTMKKGRVSDAFIMDAVASSFMEHIIQMFWQEKGTALQKKENRYATVRFSPGYCDWPVTGQKKLFKVLSENPIKVMLSESMLMSPRKSVSGVFGISEPGSGNELKNYLPCRDCTRADCAERRFESGTREN